MPPPRDPRKREAISRIAKRLLPQVRACRPDDPPVKGKLFHYTSAGGLIGIISTASLWATACEYLNDPEEWKYGVNLTRTVLSELGSEFKGAVLEAIKGLIEDLSSGVLDPESDWYVACFCEEGDLLGQWRGYAEEGGGYCIELDSAVVRAWASSHEARLIQVEYRPKKQMELLATRLRCALRVLQADLRTNSEPVNLWQIAAEAQLRTIVLPLIGQFKHPSFKSEGERRLGYLVGTSGIENEFSQVKFRTGRRFVIPYLPMRVTAGTASNRSLPVVSVRCGPTTHPSLGKAGVEALLRHYGYGRVPVKASRIPYRD
jgi:hypothetical protein